MVEFRSPTEVAEDENAPTRADTLGTHVWWLLTEQTVGSKGIVLNVNVLPPRTAHRLHRHAHAEQAVYLVSGRGVHLTEKESIPLESGAAVHIPAHEWHGFANPYDEPCKIVSIYGGIGKREDAGYELHPDPPMISGIDDNALREL